MASAHDNDFWRWVVVDGKTTDWIIMRNGCLLSSNGNYASNMRVDNGGYIRNRFEGRNYTRHRLVATAFVTNPRPDIFDKVDHIDRNPKNNRADNLRWVTHQLNLLNRRSKRCKPYQAQLQFNGKPRHLGYYKTEKDAMDVSDKTRVSLFEALYHYHTRPNTFMQPEEWILTPCSVRVRRD